MNYNKRLQELQNEIRHIKVKQHNKTAGKTTHVLIDCYKSININI